MNLPLEMGKEFAVFFACEYHAISEELDGNIMVLYQKLLS